MATRARGGSGIQGAADSEALSTIRGDRFNTNPHLDTMYQDAARGVTRSFNRTVLPNLESRFAGGNRLDSGAYQNSLKEAGRGLAGELAGMATDIYGGDYNRERAAQLGMTQNAGAMEAAGYQGAAQLGQAGDRRQGYEQTLIDDLIKRFEFAQNEPYNQIARYSTLIGDPVSESQGSSGQKSWGFSI